MKVTPALDCPPDVVTTTGPVVAPVGTLVSISSLAQLVVEAVVPLKVTVPEEPKLEPSMVTWVFTGPELGSRLEIDRRGDGHGESDAGARLSTGRPHHHRPRGGSLRHTCLNLVGGPTGGGCGGSVEGDGSRGGPEIGPLDGDVSVHQSRVRVQPGDYRRRRGHGESDSSARLPTGRPHYHRAGGGP